MKNSLIFLVASFLVTNAFGQLKFGGEAGITLFNTTHTASETEVPDGKETGAFKPGLKVGLVAEYSLIDRITLQSGVSLTTKGFKHVMYNHKGFRTPESSFEWSTNISYLELPLNILVRVGKHLRFGPGMYFSYAVGGKATITTHDQNSPTTDRTVDLTFDNPQTEEMIGFKKTDYGLLFSAAYTLPHRTFVRAQFSKV